jgi:hypothetical protein
MSVVDEVDRLYEIAVTSPQSLNDQAIQDWSDGVAAGYELDRQGAKYVRRCLNSARRLASFWVERESRNEDPVDWPSRVDLALGVRAWRPQLELAQHMLEVAPSYETYESASRLFRLVNNEPFLDDMTYEVWLTARQNL